MCRQNVKQFFWWRNSHWWMEMILSIFCTMILLNWSRRNLVIRTAIKRVFQINQLKNLQSITRKSNEKLLIVFSCLTTLYSLKIFNILENFWYFLFVPKQFFRLCFFEFRISCVFLTSTTKLSHISIVWIETYSFFLIFSTVYQAELKSLVLERSHDLIYQFFFRTNSSLEVDLALDTICNFPAVLFYFIISFYLCFFNCYFCSNLENLHIKPNQYFWLNYYIVFCHLTFSPNTNVVFILTFWEFWAHIVYGFVCTLIVMFDYCINTKCWWSSCW